MTSLRSAALAATVVFASIAKAQYSIDPDSVPLSTRQAWCSSQTFQCPVICEQLSPLPTLVNECDPTTLTYGCLCGNNQQPNISEYSLTLPFYVCQQAGNDCVANCGQNNECSSACRQDHPCGATDPKRFNTTATASTTSVPTATQTSSDTIFSGTPGSSGTSSSKNAAISALEVGRAYGLAVVLGSMFVGFAML